MWFLKIISFKDIRYLILIGVLGLCGYLFHMNKLLSKENDRNKNNYQNALKIDSLEVAMFKFTSKQEIQDLLNQNKKLNNLVLQSKVETKRIEKLYYQLQRYKDSAKSTIDVTPIVKSIRNNKPYLIPWRDSTKCLTVEGVLRYKDNNLTVEVNNREFFNETVLIKHRGRRKPVNWLLGLRLGPREINFTPRAKCGVSKVTIIDKEHD